MREQQTKPENLWQRERERVQDLLIGRHMFSLYEWVRYVRLCVYIWELACASLPFSNKPLCVCTPDVCGASVYTYYSSATDRIVAATKCISSSSFIRQFYYLMTNECGANAHHSAHNRLCTSASTFNIYPCMFWAYRLAWHRQWFRQFHSHAFIVATRVRTHSTIDNEKNVESHHVNEMESFIVNVFNMPRLVDLYFSDCYSEYAEIHISYSVLCICSPLEAHNLIVENICIFFFCIHDWCMYIAELVWIAQELVSNTRFA